MPGWGGTLLAAVRVGMARRLTVVSLVADAVALLAIAVRRDIHGLTLVIRAADLHGLAGGSPT